MKLDIEGSEPDALRGMKQTLEREGCTFLMMEFHAGLLDREQEGARAFAKKIFEMGGDELYLLDDTQPLLRQIGSLKDLLRLTDKLSAASFPHNLCNLLLVKGQAVGLSEAIRIEPWVA